MFGTIPLPLSWPVYVSHAEASAFAGGREKNSRRRHNGIAPRTERRTETERAIPGATRRRTLRVAIFTISVGMPTPVDAHPAGASAFGVFDLLGNGWEWTSTTFGPLARV